MTTTSIEKKAEGLSPTAWVVAGILLLAGIVGAIVQFTKGMSVTGLNQQIVWGLYIAGFFTAAAAGAGLLTLVGISEFKEIVPKGSRVKLLAMALASFITAGVLILLDIGAPLQAWRIITTFSFSATETWDFWVLFAVIVIALVYLLATRKASGATKILGILGIIAALALIVVESLMLGQQAAHPLWGGMTMLTFLLSMFVAGLALALILWGTGETGKSLRSWLMVGLVASLAIVFSEVLTGVVSGNTRLNEEVGSLLGGTTSPFFWFHVVVGLLLPIALLLTASSKTKAILIGALALLGVLADKLWILVAGQEKPVLALPKASYFPSWVEFLVILGAIGLAWLIYIVLTKYIWPKEITA
ncbi:MAG: hypothetical protein A2Z14_05495 [Chloroflexi bacterium RBG_16_48_8]|nr:MAG: hypothetical protein A2Z14_05495 [Chloroflexi bacterium RBG_16_48_8]